MRTTPPVIVTAIVLGLLLTSPLSARAQSSNSRYGSDAGGIFGGPPVLDAPFSAEVVTSWRPNSGGAEQRATARYYRDRAGRVRVEQMFVGHAGENPQRVLVKPDPDSLMACALDPAARTVIEVGRGLASLMVGGYHGTMVLPVTMTRYISFLSFPGGSSPWNTPVDEEDLGQRSISGIQATGTRFKTTLPPWAMNIARDLERWVSPELKLVVYSRSEDSVVGTVEYQFTRITRTEPPAELFEVPAEYVETALVGPWWWANAYRPDLTPWLKP